MKASLQCISITGAEYGAGSGKSGCAHLKHYTASYQEWGEGPPLILVPGLAGGCELVGPLAKQLATHHRVISYQLRGEDDCFALRRSFGLRDLVDDLAEFMDWQCLESPTVVGVSFGGLLALEFAARHPSRLHKLAVQGVGARLDRGWVHQVATKVLSDYPLPNDNAFVNQFFKLLFGGRHSGPLFDFVTQQCWQTDQSVMAHRFRLAEQFNLEGRMHRIRIPTLVMMGDRDMIVSEQCLQALCDGVPQAELVRLPGRGHLAFVTDSDRVSEEMNHFLLRN